VNALTLVVPSTAQPPASGFVFDKRRDRFARIASGLVLAVMCDRGAFMARGLTYVDTGAATWYDTTVPTVPSDAVDADASKLTIANKTQEAATSDTSLGIRYVDGLWKSCLRVPLFMTSKFAGSKHPGTNEISTNPQVVSGSQRGAHFSVPG
jgi:hypothetical protein